MSGDYTRMTFAPRKDFAGVLKQQGRVALEADHNELVEIVDRRWRAETIDIMGRCALPVSNPANADAFLLTPVGGSYSIGIGRIYVDGLQVECHGREPHTAYDAGLGERASGVALPFDEQPYWPTAALPAAGNYLAYVMAWQREVSVFEDDDLQEIALGGPDTATRLQTAWQVRLRSAGAATTCEDIADWDDFIAPSTGRLTVVAAAPPADTDPCTVPPQAGYRGRENRCYRVEVHTPGMVDGGATFKWSRDNGSVASAVDAIVSDPAGDRVVVRRVGRDRVLRFQVGDWVEFLDSHLEFADPGVSAGLMARIVAIEEANRTFVLDRTLGGVLDPTDLDRHTRVRRWDQRAGVNADGQMSVTSAGTALEDGITVTFGPAGGTLRAGDHWIFAARTADNSVEPLTEEPPRGVDYHFCKLAVVPLPAGMPLDDCREPWPPASATGGCCTEVVRPGESIQAAINRLPSQGGCVCLRPGEHVITEPIWIPQSHVTLHGETGGATVRRTTPGALLLINPAGGGVIADVMVHDIRFETPGADEDLFLVAIDHAADVEIGRCAFVITVANQEVADGLGARALKTTRLTLDRVEMHLVRIGLYAIDSQAITVRDCRFRAPVHSFPTGPRLVTVALGWCGVWLEDVGGVCHVERNEIRNYMVGVRLGGGSTGSVVADNDIQRPNGVSDTTSPFGELAIGPAFSHNERRVYAVDARTAGCVVHGNRINLAGPLHGGIRLAASDCRAEANAIVSTFPDAEGVNAIGIWVHQWNDDVLVDRCVVRANTLTGGFEDGTNLPAQFDGILVQGQTGAPGSRGHDVRLNRIERLAPAEPPSTLAAITLVGVRDTTVADNTVVNRPWGVLLLDARGAHVERNRLREVFAGIVAAGIVVKRTTGLRVEANVLSRANENGTAGIMGISLDDAEIADNEVDRFRSAIMLSDGSDNRVAGNRLRRGLIGILTGTESRIAIAENHVEEMEAVGIQVGGGDDATLSHNHVRRCGWDGTAGGGGPGAGIAALDVEGTVTVESCEVLETGLPPTGEGIKPAVGILSRRGDQHVIRDNRVTGPVAGVEFESYPALAVVDTNGRADVTNNVFSGAGAAEVVILARWETDRLSEVIFSGNRCRDLTPNVSRACVIIATQRLSLAGNQVTADSPGLQSFDLVETPVISAVGNVTNRGWLPLSDTTNVRPLPLELFNVINV